VRMEGGWKVEENNLEGDERNGRAEYRACCIMEEDEKEEEKRRNKEERTPSHDLAINTTGNKMCVRSARLLRMSVGRVGAAIKSKLEFLNPIFLEILNESHKHNVPPNSESHFKGRKVIFGALSHPPLPCSCHCLPRI
jgi:hypothetical protein